jgi:hypothetical protein
MLNRAAGRVRLALKVVRKYIQLFLHASYSGHGRICNQDRNSISTEKGAHLQKIRKGLVFGVNIFTIMGYITQSRNAENRKLTTLLIDSYVEVVLMLSRVAELKKEKDPSSKSRTHIDLQIGSVHEPHNQQAQSSSPPTRFASTSSLQSLPVDSHKSN